MTIPLLFLGDSPDCLTGLGRITRDLAVLASQWPEFRVATLGRGGIGSSKLPFAQYNFDPIRQWGEGYIESVWNDFAGNEKGIVFSIWDASRLFWFSCPEYLAESDLRNFLTVAPFQRWGYFPVDAIGPGSGGALSKLSAETVAGYDRALAYTKFGKNILEKSGARGYVDFIPHGIDSDTFTPRDKHAGRMALGIGDDVTLIGVNMANQARKDWGLWAEVASMLPDVHWWLQIDVRERYWSLPALISDFKLEGRVHFGRQNLDDTDLSYYYSACDLTILPSLGEGFGYPIAESLACGVPVVHHSYAGGSDVVGEEAIKVIPTGLRLDTINNVYRPMFTPEQWVAAIQAQIAQLDEWPLERCRASVEHLFWSNLAPVFKNWFMEGLV